MEFPEPTIDVDSASYDLNALAPPEGQFRPTTEDWVEFRAKLKALLAQAWEEGRWSPPGATLNPYGAPAVPLVAAGTEGFPGLRLLALRSAAQAALAWLENMAPTVRRTALAEQLRSALGGK